MRDDATAGVAVLLAAILAIVSFEAGRHSGLADGRDRAVAALAPLAGVEVATVGGAWTISDGDRVVVGETLERAVESWLSAAEGEGVADE